MEDGPWQPSGDCGTSRLSKMRMRMRDDARFFSQAPASPPSLNSDPLKHGGSSKLANGAHLQIEFIRHLETAHVKVLSRCAALRVSAQGVLTPAALEAESVPSDSSNDLLPRSPTAIPKRQSAVRDQRGSPPCTLTRKTGPPARTSSQDLSHADTKSDGVWCYPSSISSSKSIRTMRRN
ncbi:uncharacterized protein [Syngnathus scovelli]|uniref:uncharacterized protein isoform X3 n=1 Tax=Syngnathus scovelli TaxID=161590 RepID=UPI0035CA2222